jgi:hypothetical protein
VTTDVWAQFFYPRIRKGVKTSATGSTSSSYRQKWGLIPDTAGRLRGQTKNEQFDALRGGTLDEQSKHELEQIAQLVIDAYLKRDETFIPDFGERHDAILYLAHTEAQLQAHNELGHSLPKLIFWYEQSDYKD